MHAPALICLCTERTPVAVPRWPRVGQVRNYVLSARPELVPRVIDHVPVREALLPVIARTLQDLVDAFRLGPIRCAPRMKFVPSREDLDLIMKLLVSSKRHGTCLHSASYQKPL